MYSRLRFTITSRPIDPPSISSNQQFQRYRLRDPIDTTAPAIDHTSSTNANSENVPRRSSVISISSDTDDATTPSDSILEVIGDTNANDLFTYDNDSEANDVATPNDNSFDATEDLNAIDWFAYDSYSGSDSENDSPSNALQPLQFGLSTANGVDLPVALPLSEIGEIELWSRDITTKMITVVSLLANQLRHKDSTIRYVYMQT